MQRLRAYQAELMQRVKSGQLTNQEGFDLLAARVHTEGTGELPRKVKCPECAKVHRIVGSGQTFTCCSETVHSVWDCRA